jgi:hypothetical protein
VLMVRLEGTRSRAGMPVLRITESSGVFLMMASNSVFSASSPWTPRHLLACPC